MLASLVTGIPPAKHSFRGRLLALLVLAIILGGSTETWAWSSLSSHAYYDILQQSSALETYRLVSGHFPSDKYWEKLGDYYGPSNGTPSGQPLDRWGQPYIYRMPGQHGDFDLYSVGKNGIDDQGRLDDISNWAGVNDGFYWKSTWPRGRFSIATGTALGLGSLLLAFFFPWRTVLPIAVSITCAGIFLGCQWLMHPGFVDDRNGPLTFYSFAAAMLFIGLSVYFVRNLHREGIVLRQRSVPARDES